MAASPRVSSASPHTSPGKPIHILELDGLRGIAAIIVFLHHVCFTSIDPAPWNPYIQFAYRVFHYGSYGVDIFFVLSGYLITSLLLKDRESPSYYVNFYWKRALRILPLYVICLVGILIFLPQFKVYVLLAALFLSNFAHIFGINSYGPFWTLAIEEQFYLIWPTVVRRRNRNSLRRWAAILAITCMGLRVIAAAFGHYNYYFTFFRCDGLALGAYLACQFGDLSGYTDAKAPSAAMVSKFFFASIALFVAAALLPVTGMRLIAFNAAIFQAAVSLLATAIIGYILQHTGERSLVWLRRGLLPFFGIISYALYMIHMYVLALYDHIYGPLRGGDTQAYLLRLAVVGAATIALSLVSRYAIELPANSLRRFVLRQDVTQRAV